MSNKGKVPQLTPYKCVISVPKVYEKTRNVASWMQAENGQRKLNLITGVSISES